MRLGEDLIVREFVGTARFDRTPQGLVLQGEFSSQTDLECVRCLAEYVHTLKWTVTELYAFDERSITESNLLVPDDKHIDLEPLLREYALLEFPISPICKEECKGLCPVCGENLNETDCGHRPESDSPFAVLKDLLK
ncbi:DUF177 domain-containing protein [bacterium]|nr:DUF177 domain-containing protein [bacterium]